MSNFTPRYQMYTTKIQGVSLKIVHLRFATRDVENRIAYSIQIFDLNNKPCELSTQESRSLGGVQDLYWRSIRFQKNLHAE